MIVVGVTGRIGSGKTGLCRILQSRHGCAVIDADEKGHEALRTPAIRERIARRFGKGILDSRGDVDRGRLASIVFPDPEALRDLERIVHPRIVESIESDVAQLRRGGGVDIVLIDAALLLSWMDKLPVDRVVWVKTSDHRAIERLRLRGIQEDEARRRLGRQPSDEEFCRVADIVVLNEGGVEDLDRESERLWEALRGP